MIADRVPSELRSPIAHIATRTLSVPLDPMIVTSHYRIPTIELVLVRTTDRDGRCGTSSLWCFGRRQARVLTAAVEYVADHALHAADLDAASMVDGVRREINFFGYEGVSVFAMAALEMSLVDLVCRQHSIALGTALGRRRDEIPAYWSGLFGNQPLDEILDEIRDKLAEGFRAFKLRLGSAPLADDLARVRSAIELVPDGTTVMVDAVQSWTVDEALRAVAALGEYPIRWIEDPLPHDDLRGLAAVCAASPVPVATGENSYLRAGFERVLDAGATVLLADLQRSGGIREWLRVADLAAERAACLTPHVYPHLSLQLCAALDQDEVWIEYLPWWDAVSTPLRCTRRGSFAVPDEPGTGITFDDERIDALALEAWQPVR